MAFIQENFLLAILLFCIVNYLLAGGLEELYTLVFLVLQPLI